jgi:hypothetical protein
MSKRKAANTVDRMEFFQNEGNQSGPKTKIVSIIVMMKAISRLTLERGMTAATAIRSRIGARKISAL